MFCRIYFPIVTLYWMDRGVILWLGVALLLESFQEESKGFDKLGNLLEITWHTYILSPWQNLDLNTILERYPLNVRKFMEIPWPTLFQLQELPQEFVELIDCRPEPLWAVELWHWPWLNVTSVKFSNVCSCSSLFNSIGVNWIVVTWHEFVKVLEDSSCALGAHKVISLVVLCKFEGLIFQSLCSGFEMCSCW